MLIEVWLERNANRICQKVFQAGKASNSDSLINANETFATSQISNGIRSQLLFR